MKRTEREIYDYCKLRLKHIKQRLNLLTYSLDGDEIEYLLAEQEAYHDIINFIGSIRTNEN